MYLYLNSLCWPVLYPHIVGETVFPGDPMAKESVAQSPVIPPDKEEETFKKLQCYMDIYL